MMITVVGGVPSYIERDEALWMRNHNACTDRLRPLRMERICKEDNAVLCIGKNERITVSASIRLPLD